jgi:hypothetical protein
MQINEENSWILDQQRLGIYNVENIIHLGLVVYGFGHFCNGF